MVVLSGVGAGAGERPGGGLRAGRRGAAQVGRIESGKAQLALSSVESGRHCGGGAPIGIGAGFGVFGAALGAALGAVGVAEGVARHSGDKDGQSAEGRQGGRDGGH